MVKILEAVEDAEIRALVVKTLATESAQAAGLACAQPLAEPSQLQLLVYGVAGEPEAGCRGRIVRLQCVGLEVGPEVLCPEIKAGELLALLDWSEEEDALYLLTYEQVTEIRGQAETLAAWNTRQRRLEGWWRATPERWRELLIG